MTIHSSSAKKVVPTISLIQPGQVPAAAELLCAQLTEHDLPSDSREVQSVIEKIAADERYGFILVAADDTGKLIGVALGCAYLGVEHGGVSGWLEELYVLPKSRQKGVGTRLVSEVIRLAKSRGWRALDLEVTADHRRVVSLYVRHGFEPRSRSRFCLKFD